jgi:hypothetical protein
MSAGFQVTKAAIDQRVGSIVVAGESWLDDVRRQAAWFAATPDADIIPMGYAAEDVSLLKSSFVDLENLRLTAYGQRTQTPASNFFFWASKLRGIL